MDERGQRWWREGGTRERKKKYGERKMKSEERGRKEEGEREERWWREGEDREKRLW